MLKQKKITLVVLSLIILFVGAQQAFACSCYGRPSNKNFHPCGSFWGDNAVFIGLAEKVLVHNHQMIVRFSVEKPIRGVNEKTIEVFTNSSTPSCGYPFEEGERYFVYARRGQDGKLSEYLCGPTVLLKDAAEDLEYLKEIESGKSGTRLFGSVHQIKRESNKVQDSFVPLVGVEVTIKSENNTFQTKTIENGKYVFKDIPTGVYQMKAKFLNGLRDISAQGEFPNHYAALRDSLRCSSGNFVATSQGSVKGKVTGFDQKNPPRQYIWLLPIDENGKAIIEYLPVQPVWINPQNGEYFFNVVPAGKYLLAINPRNCPSPRDSEYGRMFLPGVVDESRAKTITVKDYEQAKAEDFRLLRPFKERWFSGVVLSADRTPIANATVFMTARKTEACYADQRLADVKTDESGRFRLKGYHTYLYQIRAYWESKNTGKPPKTLTSKIFEIPLEGEVKDIELIID